MYPFLFYSGLTSVFLIFGLFGTIVEHLINFDVKMNLVQLQRQDTFKYLSIYFAMLRIDFFSNVILINFHLD